MSQVTITEPTTEDLVRALHEASRKLIELQHQIDGMALLVGEGDRKIAAARAAFERIFLLAPISDKQTLAREASSALAILNKGA